ncbi:MAG: DNA polymerase III subunit gamma/tau [Phycisphaerales bacterium]|nr:DNA polymerase III subunit gamma/tau [Phycisphaerales bacterium]
MAYTVLARRYRSRTFDDVVGQDVIARTLRTAVETGRVAHAYLFTGTRGVGKTSMARIFAKALSGGSPEIDEAIMAGRDIDVIEIDAASNRGVQEARDLIANSAYRPLRGKFKVYIIDEVHMLTREAFNALLKTMEEPPEHVKFILCTTESQKVPPTIQSRCQRFDFRDIPAQRIAAHLADVAAREGLKADPDLIFAVARGGAGSMRDALSLLDRVIASGEKHLTLALLDELLGSPDRDLLSRLLDACATGEVADALEAAHAMLARGVTPDQLIESVIERLRDLLLLRACGEGTELVALGEGARADEAARAKRFDEAGLSHMIALCESVQRQSKSSSSPLALLDALLVRLAQAEKFADLASIIAGQAPGEAPARPGARAGTKK